MFASLPSKLAFSGLGFILTGMITGNMLLISLGLIPIIFILLSYYLNPPVKVTQADLGEPLSVTVDDVVEINRTFKLDPGIGLVTFGEQLPESFELIDGNNIKAVWKDRQTSEANLRYRIKCTKRGYYTLGPVNWESRHPVMVTPTILGVTDLSQELIVKPKVLKVKKIRQQKILSRIPMPAESRIKIGVPTTDFKELRDYGFGDSFKQINWKATARRSQSGFKPPVVNEYEKEGRRLVFFFLDTSRRLGLGTNLRNSFEYGVQAVLGLVEFYIARQCMVGLVLFDSEAGRRPRYPVVTVTNGKIVSDDATSSNPPEDFLFPESGRMQQYRIHRMLLRTEIASSLSSLVEALANIKGHIRGTNPLFVIVSSVHSGNLPQLTEGMKRVSMYARRSRRQKPNIMVLNVSGYRLAVSKRGDKTASQLLEFEESETLNMLRGMGVTAINWNPLEQSITQVILSQVLKR